MGEALQGNETPTPDETALSLAAEDNEVIVRLSPEAEEIARLEALAHQERIAQKIGDTAASGIASLLASKLNKDGTRRMTRFELEETMRVSEELDIAPVVEEVIYPEEPKVFVPVERNLSDYA